MKNKSSLEIWKIKILVFCILAANSLGAVLSCADPSSGTSNTDQASSPVIRHSIEQPSPVGTFLLEARTFPLELVSNGKVRATRRADLRFRGDGVIRSVSAVEDMRVDAGSVLAELDDSDQQAALRQTRLGHWKGMLYYEDQLLRQGYELSDNAFLDRENKTVARIWSGLSAAEAALPRAEADAMRTRLAAPFSGKVANLNARPFGIASSFEYICTLVDDRELTVDFLVMERELPFVRASKTVAFVPYTDGSRAYQGDIESINPLIEH